MKYFLLYMGFISGTVLTKKDLDSWLLNITKQTTCYGDLGCFGLNNPWLSWSRPIPVLPQSPMYIETKIFLMTRDNLVFPQLLRIRPYVDSTGSLIRRQTYTYIIVHGLVAHYYDEWVLTLGRNLLKTYDVNVLLVDWSNGANTLNYIQALANTRVVGAELARVITKLEEEHVLLRSQIHVIGHSLGAHVAGYAGTIIPGLHRITGLDPAKPGFDRNDAIVKLDSTDAYFVDVVHTNTIPYIGMGMLDRTGDVDFFVNGGETQPGCRFFGKATKSTKQIIYDSIQKYLSKYNELSIPIDNIQDVMKLLPHNGTLPKTYSLLDFLSGQISHIIKYITCSHSMAPYYFIEAVDNRNCSFWGVPWAVHGSPILTQNCTFQLCSQMGINSVLYPARGGFYVATNDYPPYCKWASGINTVMKTGAANRCLQNSLHNKFLN